VRALLERNVDIDPLDQLNKRPQDKTSNPEIIDLIEKAKTR